MGFGWCVAIAIVLRWEEEFPITFYLSRACQLSELISIGVILAKEVKKFVVDNHNHISEF